MKEVIAYQVQATKTTDGTKKAAREFAKSLKTALKAVVIEGAKIVVR